MKINIGGKKKKDGWKILNIQKSNDVDFVGDIKDLTQFKDSSVESIYASHVVEHVDQKNVINVFKGVYRILINGGKFYISVPDMDILCHFFVSPLADKKVKFHVMRMIFGGQVDEFDYHYFGWNFEFMEDYLKNSGFNNIEKVESFGLFDDTSDYKPYGFPISLNITATK